MQKDEIKEILDWLERENLTNILDYITNLQEEKEIIAKDFKEVSEKYFFTKSRNEKAIEKCKNKQYETNAPWLIKFAKDIENLLQGKSDE